MRAGDFVVIVDLVKLFSAADARSLGAAVEPA
jgi:hypothetical protein